MLHDLAILTGKQAKDIFKVWENKEIAELKAEVENRLNVEVSLTKAIVNQSAQIEIKDKQIHLFKDDRLNEIAELKEVNKSLKTAAGAAIKNRKESLAHIELLRTAVRLHLTQFEFDAEFDTELVHALNSTPETSLAIIQAEGIRKMVKNTGTIEIHGIDYICADSVEYYIDHKLKEGK